MDGANCGIAPLLFPRNASRMVPMKKSPAFAIALFSLGCMGVSTNASLMDPSLHLARTCPDAVKLYTTRDRVNAEYREVAVLYSTGLTRYSDEDDLIKSMRKKAARIGANGIILDPIDEPKASIKVAAEVANVLTRDVVGISPERKGHALAIYVAADSANARAMCARSR
jgi:CO dehydrogenase/acetyl-CoA synthase gamma subunit (corrinoid Fe-S protein)